MKAYTAYNIIDSNEDTCALVRYMTKSGVKHQVRVHSASSLQCPILGDHKFSSFDAEPQILPLRLLQYLGIKGNDFVDKCRLCFYGSFTDLQWAVHKVGEWMMGVGTCWILVTTGGDSLEMKHLDACLVCNSEIEI